MRFWATTRTPSSVYTRQGVPVGGTSCSRARLPEPGLHRQRPLSRGDAQSRIAVRPRALGGTGYVSILPVDQGIEHSAAASFSKNPASSIRYLLRAGARRRVQRRRHDLRAAGHRLTGYVHRIPFIVKLNHNMFLHLPNTYDQILFGSVRQAFDLGAAGVGAPSTSAPNDWTANCRRSPRASPRAPRSGCSPCCGATCATPAFKKDGVNYEVCRPTSPARPTTWASPSRPASSSRSSRRTTAATPPSASARPTRSSTTSSPPTTRSTYPLAGRQLLRRADRPHQLGRGVQGRRRPGPGGAHRRDQQARRRHGPHRRPQGLPAPAGRGRRPHPRHSGRLPGRRGHRRLSDWAPE